jgi:hypothetical protein
MGPTQAIRLCNLNIHVQSAFSMQGQETLYKQYKTLNGVLFAGVVWWKQRLPK